MIIFKKDLSHPRIVLCVLFLLVSCVTCQLETETAYRREITKVTAESVIGIVLLSFFLLMLVVCCFKYGFFSAEIELINNAELQSLVRRGLDKEVIESFPTFLYTEFKGLKIGKGGVECAICLSEFEDDESLRWMPPCSHTFHANCIDVWLSSRSTCPVCRANLSIKPDERFSYPSMDLEMANGQRDDLELTNEISVTRNNNANNTTPRSSSAGLLSSWRMDEKLFPRSHSTGHPLVQLGENLERFTLQLPDEVQQQLVKLNLIRRTHRALPRASSPRQGYRSGSVGNQRSGFSQGRQTLRRVKSMSPCLSFQDAPIQSTLHRDDHMRETSLAEDKHFGERSFQRLMPERISHRKG